MKNEKTLTRRAMLKGGLMTGAALPLIGMLCPRTATAGGPDLDPADPTAKALGYVTKSAKPGQECSSCMQFVGKAGDAKGGCNIFPGKQVAGGGWCLSYVKKAGT